MILHHYKHVDSYILMINYYILFVNSYHIEINLIFIFIPFTHVYKVSRRDRRDHTLRSLLNMHYFRSALQNFSMPKTVKSAARITSETAATVSMASVADAD